MRPVHLFILAALLLSPSGSAAQRAQIREEVRSIQTYPFSDPDPVPILTRDERLYPYHAFQGYAAQSEPRDWKVVTLENDYIQVFVLPEVGGKVWGAVIKATGEEFIYRNEVMKFRNIALRGPWTSGGIEFNFGVIGHTPSTATPVDYQLLENEDGSVSCVVGTMDLPSRTHWRVEIRLAPDKAYFETNVLWYNPTSTWQPYYNWMTAAAFAREDLRMYIPGNRYLGHPGESHAWPLDSEGRYLPDYKDNHFGGHKSFHVVGTLEDHFGGYYQDDDYGFGTWSRHEELPGQKLWLWALSRQGGVWEDLLTDTDGQYVEYQAGRMHVQYAPGSDINPIKQATFEPGAADRWGQIWFPVVEIGGLTDVSRRALLHVEDLGTTLEIGVQGLESVRDTLRVVQNGQMVEAFPLDLHPLSVLGVTIPRPVGDFEVVAPRLGLRYSTDHDALALARPFETDPAALPAIPEADTRVAQARELIEARYLIPARSILEEVLEAEPWNRDALVALANLDFRQARYSDGLERIERARQLDAYDAEANFIAGNLYRAARSVVDAREAYGWAARSMAFRSVAYTQLADLALIEEDWDEAGHYANLALDYDRVNLQALQALAIVARRTGDVEQHALAVERMLEIDPLNHPARAERFLWAGDEAVGRAAQGRRGANVEQAARALLNSMRSEFPEQSLVEVAMGYAQRAQVQDARRLLSLAGSPGPVARAWQWHLGGREGIPAPLTASEVDFMFPFRVETLPVLRAAAEAGGHWSWTYLLSLNLWGLGRGEEAADIMSGLGNAPDLSAFYVARASLVPETAEDDLLRAQQVEGSGRLSLIQLIRHYQDTGQWAKAEPLSARGRATYPQDFNLDLLHSGTLLFLDRAAEAVDILEATHVLPSENASQSHQMFEWAHIMAGLDLIATDRGRAASHFRRAMEWPEHLGQGRPYEPDERLPAYLLAAATGDVATAARLRPEVKNMTGKGVTLDEILARRALELTAGN